MRFFAHSGNGFSQLLKNSPKTAVSTGEYINSTVGLIIQMSVVFINTGAFSRVRTSIYGKHEKRWSDHKQIMLPPMQHFSHADVWHFPHNYLHKADISRPEARKRLPASPMGSKINPKMSGWAEKQAMSGEFTKHNLQLFQLCP